jgi:hypothetical protein
MVSDEKFPHSSLPLSNFWISYNWGAQVLGVSPLEKFDTIKATYRRKHKDAERQGNEAAMARVCNYLFFQCPNVVDLLSDHIS